MLPDLFGTVLKKKTGRLCMVNNGGLQPQASATLLCPMFDSSMTKTNMGISEKIVAN